MITYKLFCMKNGKLYSLYVEHSKEMPLGVWLKASVGEKVDENHVKASGCGGKLAFRPGFHSTKIPFTDWIGQKMPDGSLAQRKNHVWCECEVQGNEQIVTSRRGLKMLPNDWYLFKTNTKQKDPWIISNNLKINKILTHGEVVEICKQNGIEAQKLA